LRVHQCFIQQPGSRCNPLTPALTPDMRPLRPRCLGQLPNSLYEAIFGTQGSSNPPTPRSQSEPDCSSSRVTGVRNANAWCFSGSWGPGRWSPGGGVVATHRIGGVGAPHLAVPAFWLCVRVKRRVDPTLDEIELPTYTRTREHRPARLHVFICFNRNTSPRLLPDVPGVSE
jgi:hypothetical protein